LGLILQGDKSLEVSLNNLQVTEETTYISRDCDEQRLMPLEPRAVMESPSTGVKMRRRSARKLAISGDPDVRPKTSPRHAVYGSVFFQNG